MLWPGKRDLVGILVSIISVLMHITVVMEYVTVYVLILNSVLSGDTMGMTHLKIVYNVTKHPK